MAMNRVVYYGPGDIRIEKQVPKASIGEDELRVKVEAAAICGTDVKTFFHGNPRITRIPGTMGHEFCGTITEVGSAVDGFFVGERVTMATTIGCGECEFCKSGFSNRCANAKAIGFQFDGSMAGELVIPGIAIRNGNVVKIGNLSPLLGAICEPASCAMNDITRMDLSRVNDACVLGCGALGMIHAFLLKEKGIKNIVCVEFPGHKKDLLENLGFTVLTPSEFEEQYLALSEGKGFELVIITAPSNEVQAAAPRYARKGGMVSYFASLPVGGEMILMNSREIHYKELVLYGTSDSTPEHVKLAVEAMSRMEEEMKKIITVLPLSEFHEGVKGIREGRYAKVVLIPEEDA